MTTVTLDQLAHLYQAANDANRDLSAALRSKDAALIGMLRQRSSEANSAYADAKRRYKRQQKAVRRNEVRATMIRFYLDAQEAVRL